MRLIRRPALGRPPAWTGVALVALLLTGCAKQGISPQGQDVHRLYITIMILAAPVFVGVEALLLWCVFRYRRRDDQPAPQKVGGARSLGIFFAIPAVIVATLFPFGEATLMQIERRGPAPG